jgi:tetratricopeptide (TPR) repeat protein
VAAQLTGLWREGHRDYLLEDARGAADRGQNLLTEAVARYRKFLEFEPDNASVHAELARALAQIGSANSDERQEAAAEMLSAIALHEQSQRFDEAARCYADAHALGIPLAISARERLRLATAAEEAGDAPTAAVLLRLLIAETPESHEDEMARLKLGHLLIATEPQQARKILISFVEKYPDSAWIKRIRDLLKQTYTR